MQKAIELITQSKSTISLSKNIDQSRKLNSILQEHLTTFYNTLAAYFLKCSESHSFDDENQVSVLNIQVNQYINKAMDISYQEPSTCIIRGFSSIASGQIDQAEQEFDNVLIQNRDDILSCLGKAITCFHKEKYIEALEQYKKVIKINPL